MFKVDEEESSSGKRFVIVETTKGTERYETGVYTEEFIKQLENAVVSSCITAIQYLKAGYTCPDIGVKHARD